MGRDGEDQIPQWYLLLSYRLKRKHLFVRLDQSERWSGVHHGF
jgi:hypothetical protein